MVKETYYKNSFTLEELQKLHKNFRCFDNIDEALAGLLEIFEENKYELVSKENDKMFILLKIPKFGKGEETILIEIKKNSLSLKNICDNLIQKINVLDKQMKDLNNEINMLKEENRKKDIIIKELKEWKDNIIKKEQVKEVNEKIII